MSDRRYGWKLVRPDGRTRGDFRWPLMEGAEVVDVTPEVACAPHASPCPKQPGDGLCVGLTPRGVALGGFSSPTLLVVSWDDDHTAAEDADKVRVQGGPVRVEAVLDWWRLLREGAGRGADLRYANLRGADLRGANLRGADLRGADLRDADLRDADLWGADLRGANLRGADLWGANLRGANLRGADLRGWERGPDGFARRKEVAP